jgi:thymidylate synthase ThyX
MAYASEILADSVSPQGHRLTTFCVTLPRIVLAELNTHCMLSRNSASSRAIPVSKSIAAVEEDPFVPAQFVKNQPGMQADNVLSDDESDFASVLWMGARDAAVEYAAGLEKLEVHKALANRILEPFKWHTVIITATDWSNFFALRTHETAQPEIRDAAVMMQEQYERHQPQDASYPDYWHLPLVQGHEIYEDDNGYEDIDVDWNFWKKVSIGRCARVSYLTHHGKREPEADVALHDKLLESHHLSPFEHVARPFDNAENVIVDALHECMDGLWVNDDYDHPLVQYLYDRIEYQGKLRGWHSARMDVPNESDFGRTNVPS